MSASLDGLAKREVKVGLGYFPNAAKLASGNAQDTIQAGNGVWLEPGGRVVPGKNVSAALAPIGVGARIFAINQDRLEINGGMQDSGMRLPFAGAYRYHKGEAILFLSELTSQQVYINETAIAGMTTSATAGRLRVSIPNGVGGYNTYDAGFDKVTLNPADVTTIPYGITSMRGKLGVALCAWRSSTGAIGPMSDIVWTSVEPNNQVIILIHLPTAVWGQDGFIVGASRWNDESGALQIYRYVRLAPRGTFRATNGSPVIDLGVGTLWLEDLGRGDTVTIDGADYIISNVYQGDTADLSTPFAGVTGTGKTMTIKEVGCEWYDGSLGAYINQDTARAPAAATIVKFAGRILLPGIREGSSNTGSGIAVCLEDNPEHVSASFGIGTDSGSQLVHALAAERTLYLMTYSGLEAVDVTGRDDVPYLIRGLAEPGFKALSNGCIYKNQFYGFNMRPLRTLADGSIDVQFAAPVWNIMEDWDGRRVVMAIDPNRDAVLYCYDNLDDTTTTVVPWMAQQNVWDSPFEVGRRLLDSALVNGTLYFTYYDISLLDEKVTQWEGGSDYNGYVATQYIDLNLLSVSVLKFITVAGLAASVSVFTAIPGVETPDVSDLAQAEATFTLEATDQINPIIEVNLEACAIALRFDFTDEDQNIQKILLWGIPMEGVR